MVLEAWRRGGRRERMGKRGRKGKKWEEWRWNITKP